MQYADPTFLVLSLAGIVYLVMFVVILRTRSLREHAVGLLQIFLLASIARIVSQALLRLTLMGLLAGFDTYALERIGIYLLLVLAVLFYKLTCLFERREGSGLYGWIVGTVFLAVGVVVYENLLGLPDFLMQVGESVIVRWLVGFSVLVVGWELYMGGTVVMTANAYRRVTSPLHKNRNKYWSLAGGTGGDRPGAAAGSRLPARHALATAGRDLSCLCAANLQLARPAPGCPQVGCLSGNDGHHGFTVYRRLLCCPSLV